MLPTFPKTHCLSTIIAIIFNSISLRSHYDNANTSRETSLPSHSLNNACQVPIAGSSAGLVVIIMMISMIVIIIMMMRMIVIIITEYYDDYRHHDNYDHLIHDDINLMTNLISRTSSPFLVLLDLSHYYCCLHCCDCGLEHFV